MGFKLLIFALVAVSFIQGFADAKHVEIVDPSYNLGSIIDSFKEIVQKFHESIQKALLGIEEIIKNLAGEVKEAWDALVADFHKDMEQIKEDIKELIKEAHKHGEECIKCVNASVPDIEQLYKNTQDKIVVCNKDVTETSEKFVNDVKDSVHDLHNAVVTFVDEFKNCSNIFCQIGAFNKLHKEFGAIKEHVSTFVPKYIDDITLLMPIAQECVNGAMSEYVSEMQVIHSTILECIKNLSTTPQSA
jgi:phage-related protein